MSAVIVIGFVFCSLIASYVLFKLLQSTALVGGTGWQAGGALAGFVIVFWGMQTAYKSNYDIDEMKSKLALTEQELDSANQRLAPKTITGKIKPNLIETKVVLAVAVTDPDGNGIFRLNGRCLDADAGVDDLRLYFIKEGRNVFQFLESLPTAGQEFDIEQLAHGQ